jgi:eight-cysteine-cluster-containing protein
MKKDKFKIFVLILAILGFLGVVDVVYFTVKNSKKFLANKTVITNFEECVAVGNAVMESYPRQCRHGEKTFVEDIGNELEKIDLIRTSEPRPGSSVTSPLTIRGEARGSWFFEASFPVKLFDDKGKEIFSSYVMTSAEWMTNDFVPFEKVFEFEDVSSGTGTLVLYKDNPSGLPEHDDKLEIPIKFRGSSSLNKKCIVTGCSGQVCADQQVNTTCEYREHYACYSEAKCERQENGTCGWTESEELSVCLEKNGVNTTKETPRF